MPRGGVESRELGGEDEQEGDEAHDEEDSEDEDSIIGIDDVTPPQSKLQKTPRLPHQRKEKRITSHISRIAVGARRVWRRKVKRIRIT